MARTHTVQRGETLSGIGKKYGVDYRKITGYRSGNPNLIYGGERLTLPGGTPVTATKKNVPVVGSKAPTMSNEMKAYLNDYQTRLAGVKGSSRFSPFANVGRPGQTSFIKEDAGRGTRAGLARELPGIPGEEGETGEKGGRGLQPTGQGGEQVYDPILGEIKDFTTPSMEMPEAPDLSDLFGELRGEYGVDTMEAELNALQEVQREGEARLRERTKSEKGKQVGMGVIAGRVSEVESQEMERLDFVGRQISRKTDQLNSSYKAIDMFINLENLDFGNAMNRYKTEFEQNMSIYNAFTSQKRWETEFEQRLIEHDQQAATANLQIYADMIVKGSMNWSSIDKNTQTEIHKLEIKSGLGFGFLSTLKMPPGSNIKSITNRTDQSGMKWADVIYINPDGSMRVEHKKLGQEYKAPSGGGGGGSSGGGTAGERQQQTDSSWITGITKRGSSARNASIRAVQQYDVDRTGPKTIISRSSLTDAANYLVSRYGISLSAAQASVTEVVNSHHYTVR